VEGSDDRRVGAGDVQGRRQAPVAGGGSVGEGAPARPGTARPGCPFGGPMDDPHLIERERASDRLRPRLHGERSLARVQALPWLLCVLTMAPAAWCAWQGFGPEDNGDPLATSLGAIEKQNGLTVSSAQLSPVVSGEDSRLLVAIRSRQGSV